MQKLTKDAKKLQNKIRAFLKKLGVAPRPKRIKTVVDFMCDFVNEDHNKAVKDVESEVFKDNIMSKDVTAKSKSQIKRLISQKGLDFGLEVNKLSAMSEAVIENGKPKIIVP